MRFLQIRIILISLIFICLGIFVWVYFFSKNSSQDKSALTLQSSGEIRTSVIISPVPTPKASPSPSPTPAPSVRPSPGKQSYVIAAFGDSMVDTMGENLDYLDKSMMARYPTTKFKFYNYGIGSLNVVEANKRFGNAFSYKTRAFPAINQINADIIIISSFAYNPLYPYDKNAYWISLKEIVEKAKSTNAGVYLLVEISPLKTGFGKGVGGVNWDEQKTKSHVGLIISNLDAAVSLAAQTSTPLINAYKVSQVDGKYGEKAYVGTYDGIHPSVDGEIFMAEIIADTLKLP